MSAKEHARAERIFPNVKDIAFRSGLQVAGNYLISTVATPSNFLAIAAASSLEIFSFKGLGAPSTRSLASFRPRAVTSRTALMVLILFAPASFRMTVNSVFSSAGECYGISGGRSGDHGSRRRLRRG